MVVSERSAKWILRFYPPLLFQRVWVKKIGEDFKTAEVAIYKSLLNRNYNGTIFGGTLYSAIDPFYPFMYYQILRRRNKRLIMWLKSAGIQYIKPGDTSLTARFSISDKDIQEAEEQLSIFGKLVKTHQVEIFNKRDELCATAQAEVYIRELNAER